MTVLGRPLPVAEDAAVRLDVDELLHRLLSGTLDEWYRRGVELTVLDPRRLAPALESPSERVFNLASACETHGLSPAAVSALVRRRGVASLALAALIDERCLKDMVGVKESLESRGHFTRTFSA